MQNHLYDPGTRFRLIRINGIYHSELVTDEPVETQQHLYDVGTRLTYKMIGDQLKAVMQIPVLTC